MKFRWSKGNKTNGASRQGLATTTTTHYAAQGSGNIGWEKSLERVIPAIVVIRVCSVRAFDGYDASYSYATGFVVDKERGIVLTNRHVVTPGPVIADAVFINKEEVELFPLFYDPVHDFGFYRFDPKSVKFLDIAEIELSPEGAQVGVEIRVVGNDSGEKLSILPGILARLDREAPFYGKEDYNDFNTFYYAAASSSSGGSSGSPVLTREGKAVALNCGAVEAAAAAFFLPLHKVVKALSLIQKGEKVQRGTVQTILKHTAFDEVRRLGLSTEKEAEIRKAFPTETGTLVVNQVIPQGPAYGILDPGDVVLRINHKMVTTFLPWEDMLDSRVGGEVEVEFQRGGIEMTAKIKVGDLHDITPSEYVEVSSALLHPLSYQQAKNHNLPCCGVYMAFGGYMLARGGLVEKCLINAVGLDPTPDLDTFEAAVSKHPDGARVAVRFTVLRDHHRVRTAVITIDRKWFPMERWRRDDRDGVWHATPSPLPPPYTPPTETVRGAGMVSTSSVVEGQALAAAKPKPQAKAVGRGIRVRVETGGEVSGAEGAAPRGGEGSSEQEVDGGGSETAGPGGGDGGGGVGVVEPVGASLRSSLVMVSFDLPFMLNCVSGMGYTGTGVVVDVKRGLVVVDKNTVPLALGDVRITFNGCQEVPADVIFIHPVHNFSLVRFDPSKVRAGRFSEAKLCGPGGDLVAGDRAEFNGLTAGFVPVCQKLAVTKVERLALLDPTPPQYMAHNVEVVFFDRLISSGIGGVLVTLPKQGLPSKPLQANEPVGRLGTSAGAGGAEARRDDNGGSGGSEDGNNRNDSHDRNNRNNNVQVSAFWFSFGYMDEDGDSQDIFNGFHASIVRRTLLRLLPELDAADAKKAGAKEASDPNSSPSPGPSPEQNGGGGGGEAAEEHLKDPAEAMRIPSSVQATGNANGNGHSHNRANSGAGQGPLAGVRLGLGLGGEGEELGLAAVHCLPLQLIPVGLSKANSGLGLSEEWGRRIEQKCSSEQKQVLGVRRCMAGTPAASLMKTGDLILSLQGQLVTRFKEVEAIVEECNGSVEVVVLRDQKEQTLTVPTSCLPTVGTHRVLLWAGLMLQTPHLAVFRVGFLPDQGGGVYVSRWCYGSPAHKFGVEVPAWIVEVNGSPTPTLDAFLKVVKNLGDKSPVRLKTVDLDAKVEVITLKTDNQYWPTLEVCLKGTGGKSVMHGRTTVGARSSPLKDNPSPAHDTPNK